MKADEQYMGLALAEARIAAEAGEVPVGAVVVDGSGQVISRAGNRSVTLNDPSGHAEMLALRQAGEATGNYRLTDCSVFVTLEPCVMCAGAMIHARIKRLVYGATDPKTGGVDSCYRVGSDGLLNHDFEITSGVMADESSRMLQAFFKERRSGQRKCDI
ncbi:MAG: tRNA adenosine(34) deaminase TadA [Proteobacteria bacterium]|nr:tRNA adenosine(34) deaminase TadA [Pseudomonadota bacterium]MBU1688351.1 tRNA adenosine(34) deaminase TadA [Pseudomonadota bacterium]